MAWEEETVKLLRDELHASQKGNRELVEVSRDLHVALVDLTLVVRGLRDELVLIRLDYARRAG